MTGHISPPTPREKRYGKNCPNPRSLGKKSENYRVLKGCVFPKEQAAYHTVLKQSSLPPVFTPSSYKTPEILCFLEKKKISYFKDSNAGVFNAGIFQVVLFSQSWTEDPKTRAYLYKHFSELLRNLQQECDEAYQAYRELQTKQSYQDFRVKHHNLYKVVAFLDSLEFFFQKNQKNLEELAKITQDDFSFSQEKLSLFFFVQAALRDISHRVKCFAQACERGPINFEKFWPKSQRPFWEWFDSREDDICLYVVINSVIEGKLSYSSKEITENERIFAQNIAKALTPEVFLEKDDFFKKTIPGFSQSGGLGINAILYSMLCCGKLPFSGISSSTKQCYKPHNGYYYMEEAPRFGVVFHDINHLNTLWQTLHSAPFCKQIYLNINDPNSLYTPAQRKADLLILFLFVHENILFLPYLRYLNKQHTFQDTMYLRFFENKNDDFDVFRKLMQLYLDTEADEAFYFTTADLLPLLKALLTEDEAFSTLNLKHFSFEHAQQEPGGLRIVCAQPELYTNEQTNTPKALGELLNQEIFQAIEALWIAFRERHKDCLDKEGITPEKTPFLFKSTLRD